MNISGKVAMVTGGADGIGKAIVGALLERGAKGVAVADIDSNNGEQTVKEFQNSYGSERVIFHKCDVSSQDSMEDVFSLTKTTFGQLNIVCNNAGILDEVDWEKMLRVNLNGVICGTKLAIKHLDSSEGNEAVVINIASETAIKFYTGVPVYTTSKVAILGYTRHTARCDPELQAKKIRLNAVCPSMVDTKLLERATVPSLKQPGQPLPDFDFSLGPQDVVKAVLRLIEENHTEQSMHVPSEGEPYLLRDDQLVPTEIFIRKFKHTPAQD